MIIRTKNHLSRSPSSFLIINNPTTLFIMHQLIKRCFSTSPRPEMVMKLTKLRVVDNSAIGKQAMIEGKPPKVIHIYSKLRHYGFMGDKVMVAIKGQKKKGIVVGCRKTQDPLVPKFDSNNLVLIDNKEGNPLGTRILAPLPNCLRKNTNANMAKIFAIATKFV